MHSLNNCSITSFSNLHPSLLQNISPASELVFLNQPHSQMASISPPFFNPTSTLLSKRVSPYDFSDALLKKPKLNHAVPMTDFFQQNVHNVSQNYNQIALENMIQSSAHYGDQETIRQLQLLNGGLQGKLNIPYQNYNQLEPLIIDNNFLTTSAALQGNFNNAFTSPSHYQNAYANGFPIYNDYISAAQAPFIQHNEPQLQVIAVPIMINMPTEQPAMAQMMPQNLQNMQFIAPLEQNHHIIYPAQQMGALPNTGFHADAKFQELPMRTIQMPVEGLPGNWGYQNHINEKLAQNNIFDRERKEGLNVPVTNSKPESINRKASRELHPINLASHEESAMPKAPLSVQTAKPNTMQFNKEAKSAHVSPAKSESKIEKTKKIEIVKENEGQRKEIEPLIIPPPKVPEGLSFGNESKNLRESSSEGSSSASTRDEITPKVSKRIYLKKIQQRREKIPVSEETFSFSFINDRGQRRKNRWQLKQEEEALLQKVEVVENKPEVEYVQKIVDVRCGMEHQVEIPDFGLIEDDVPKRMPKMKWNPEVLSSEEMENLVDKLEEMMKIPVNMEKLVRLLGENENDYQKVMELVQGDLKKYIKFFTLVKKKPRFGL